ncbi:MAG: fibronectin type III domain-containing protein [Caldilineaceae bacterium]|nr:fibronectin type III domain-containing protein [Caldilineaceae bacterium]
MKQKSVGLTLRVAILALALILVAGSPVLPPFDGVAYAQTGRISTLTSSTLPNGNLQLDWTAVANADEYRLWKGEGSGSSVSWGDSAHMTFDSSTMMYVDTAVTAGMTYSYVVEVYDGDDNRLGWSTTEEVTLPGGTQAPTAKPTVTLAADGLTAITVTWTDVDGADWYRVRYWTAGLSGWMDLATRHTGDRTYSHTGLTPGTQYFYIVRGENDGGSGPYSGSPGNYASHTLQATSATPTLSLDHTSRTVVEVSWTPAPAGSKYNLHRRKVTTDSGDPVVVVPADDTGWAQLGGGYLTATSYTDSAANYTPDTSGTAPFTVKYEYRVQAIDSNDVAGDWSAVKSVSIPEAGAVLGAPTASAQPVSSSSTRVTWGAITGAAFYELRWKSGDGNYNTPFRVDGTSYEHGNLSPSTKYTYQVRAVDINGVGDWSAETNTTTRSVAAAAGQMPKVTGLTVTDATTDNTGDDRMAKLTWNAVLGATHYEIQRFNHGATTPAWAVVTGGSPAVDAGRLTTAQATSSPTWTDTITSSATEGAGQTYYYAVSAVEDGVDNTVGNDDDELGEFSDIKSVTFVDYKPLMPTDVSAAKTNGASIVVKWTQPNFARDADPNNGAATSWTISWRPATTTTWTSMAVTGARSYHHTGLSGNTTYYYRVRAENAGGMSEFTAPVSETLGNALRAPSNVRAVDATTTTGPRIKVSWSAVAGADSYQVQRFGDDGTWGDLADDSTGATPYASVTGTEVIDDGDNDTATNTGTALTANTTYLYRVRMEQEGVMSGWSMVASGTTMAAETATAPTLVATTTGQSMIRLSWGSVMGATAYHLEWLEGAQAATVFDNPNTNANRITIGGNFSNYVHTGLKAGTQYSYRIRAVLSDSEGAWTTADVQPWTKPAAPDVSAAATDSDTITLTWTAVKVGGADLTDTANYRVEWRVAASGDAWAAPSETVTCTGTSCTLVDADLDAKTHYQYRVRTESPTANGNHNSYWDYTNQRTPAE